jgi:uncharacterized protein with von Willebrand factor type A (vWA) domain
LIGAEVFALYDWVLQKRYKKNPSIQWFLHKNGTVIFYSPEAVRDGLQLKELLGSDAVHLETLRGKEEILPDGQGQMAITAKTERALRKNAMDQIFGKIRKSGAGNHKSKKSGQGDEATGEFRSFQFGDSFENISVTESLKNLVLV